MKERFKSWFVSRAAFEQAIRRAEVAEALVESTRTDSLRQINFAYEQSNKSIEQAREAIRDARAAMNQAIDMSKTASKVLFGGVTDTVSESTSVSANDALVARRRREEEARKPA